MAHLPSLERCRLPWKLLDLLRMLPARLVLALGGSSSMARCVEEAWVEVPCVEVPLDFLTTGVLGSLRRSWVKSGSCSTCLLSCTALLRVEEVGGKRGKVGRE